MTYAFLNKATAWVKSISASAGQDSDTDTAEGKKTSLGYVELRYSGPKSKSDGFEGLC